MGIWVSSALQPVHVHDVWAMHWNLPIGTWKEQLSVGYGIGELAKGEVQEAPCML